MPLVSRLCSVLPEPKKTIDDQLTIECVYIGVFPPGCFSFKPIIGTIKGEFNQSYDSLYKTVFYCLPTTIEMKGSATFIKG